MSESIQIPVIIDNRQGKKALDEVGQKAVQTGEKVGTSIKKVGRASARAVVSMSASIGAVTAGVAAQERAWLGVGNTVLTSFAAGGIVGGSVAAVGALIGVLTANLEDGAKETERRLKGITSETTALRVENAKLADELERLQGVNLLDRDLDKLNDKIGKLLDRNHEVMREQAAIRKALKAADANEKVALFKRRADLQLEITSRQGIVDGLSTQRGELEKQRAALAAIAALNEGKRVEALNKKIDEQVTLMRSLNRARTDFEKFRINVENQAAGLEAQGAGGKQASGFRDAATEGFFEAKGKAFADHEDSMRRQIELVNAVTPLERARIQIAQNLAIAIKAASVPESAPEELKRQAEEMKALSRELAFAQTESVLRDGPGEFEKFQASIKPGIAGALSQGIMAGAKDGFDGAKDVAMSFLNSMSSRLLNTAANVAINALGSSFGGSFAGGGDFIADRPQLIQVGERGAERIRVDPLTGSRGANASNGGGGGDTIILQISGGLGNFSRSELTAMIRAGMAEYSNAARKRRARDSRRAL